jgi:hypothetical protein
MAPSAIFVGHSITRWGWLWPEGQATHLLVLWPGLPVTQPGNRVVGGDHLLLFLLLFDITDTLHVALETWLGGLFDHYTPDWSLLYHTMTPGCDKDHRNKDFRLLWNKA